MPPKKGTGGKSGGKSKTSEQLQSSQGGPGGLKQPIQTRSQRAGLQVRQYFVTFSRITYVSHLLFPENRLNKEHVTFGSTSFGVLYN